MSVTPFTTFAPTQDFSSPVSFVDEFHSIFMDRYTLLCPLLRDRVTAEWGEDVLVLDQIHECAEPQYKNQPKDL
ncbi:hypothetical protein KIPB_014774, partial [Kipferlia bialata]|eukprot:g14774.t1